MTRNINEHDREMDRQNLEKAREAKGQKHAGSQSQGHQGQKGHGRNITEHDRQVDRENLEKAREAKSRK